MELSHEKLTEMVVGKPQKPAAVFYEKAMLDVEASKRENRRVYVPTVYIKVTQAGVTDSISSKATQKDVQQYPEEFAHFQRTRQGVDNSVPINIIPNVELIHLQELLDMGFTSVQDLAKALQVPPHLEYARRSAVMLAEVLKEQENDHKESIPREQVTAGREVEESREAAPLPAPDRRSDPTPVGRPELPRSEQRQDEEVAKVPEAAGSVHGHQGLRYNNIDNWVVEGYGKVNLG